MYYIASKDGLLPGLVGLGSTLASEVLLLFS